MKRQHVMVDVEAYGPPGIGRPFALGAAKFDRRRGVYARRQWNLKCFDGPFKAQTTANIDTLDWLSKQSPQVLEQMRGGIPFAVAWTSFLTFVGDFPTVFWADDYGDFAWLEIEVRAGVPDHACDRYSPLRMLGPQYDSSAIVALADPLQVYSVEEHGELTKHVAEHDAVRGALDLLAAHDLLKPTALADHHRPPPPRAAPVPQS